MWEHYSANLTSPNKLSLLVTGSGAVSMFFVISGYLSISSYENAGKSFMQYIKKKLMAIVPMYYFILIVAVIFQYVSEHQVGIYWIRYFTFTNMLIPSHNFPVCNNMYGFWFMSNLFIYYFLTPILYKLFQKFNKEMICLGTVIIFFAQRIVIDAGIFGTLEVDSNINPFATLYLFVLGMYVAVACKDKFQSKAAFFIGLVLLMVLIINKSGYILWGVAAAVILLTTEEKLVIKLKPVNVVLNWLDKLSFPIYITHMIIFSIYISINNDNLFKMSDLVICIVITLVASFILYKLNTGIKKLL